MPSMYLWWCALLPMAVVVERCAASDHYCGAAGSGARLRFSRELSGDEYVAEGRLMSLHCCADGYRSIEWFKDGVPYPWSGDVSSFLLSPRSANQTVQSARAARSDAGRYACSARNSTHSLRHLITLHVLEQLPESPMSTFKPTDQWVELGRDVSFFCEAYVGRINLPDADSKISWHRVRPVQDVPISQLDVEHYAEEIVRRQEGEVVGAYLRVNGVRAEDYGEYRCSVRTTGDQLLLPVWLHHAVPELEVLNMGVPWRRLWWGVVVVALALVTLLVLYTRYGPHVILCCRQMRAVRRSVQKDGHEFEVLVCCTTADEALVRQVLLPALQRRHGYRCLLVMLADDTHTWFGTLEQEVWRCGALVCVVSPQQHTPTQLATALSELRTLPLTPLYVLLQELPKFKEEAKNERGETIISVLRRSKLLAWRYLNDRRFWLALRLALPVCNAPENSAVDTTTINVVALPPPLHPLQRELSTESRDALV